MTAPLPKRARSVSDGVKPSRVRKHADSPPARHTHPRASLTQLAPTAREGMGWTLHSPASLTIFDARFITSPALDDSCAPNRKSACSRPRLGRRSP